MTYTYLYNFFILLIHILLIYTNIFISKTKKLKKNSPQENSSHSWLVKYTFSRYIVIRKEWVSVFAFGHFIWSISLFSSYKVGPSLIVPFMNVYILQILRGSGLQGTQHLEEGT